MILLAAVIAAAQPADTPGTDSNRKVQTIHAGTDSITYVEGCA